MGYIFALVISGSMVYQQQKYISHCSGGWEVQDQGIW
jgi:hypothetical protein